MRSCASFIRTDLSKFLGASASYGNFQGSNAFGMSAIALPYGTKSSAIVANAGAGIGLDTNVVGVRGAVGFQWCGASYACITEGGSTLS